ncbi:MAG: hypothetical protein ACI9H9_000023 [Pseudoalteromonas tetraodonis]|jgi:hypothetical protein|nr:hypothetical protein PSM_A1885 [Pseudoalteromonas sp. SM9913]
MCAKPLCIDGLMKGQSLLLLTFFIADLFYSLLNYKKQRRDKDEMLSIASTISSIK